MTSSKLDVVALVDSISWGDEENVRVLWMCASGESRSEIADKVRRLDTPSVIFPVVLREVLFTNANSILADFNRLVFDARESLQSLAGGNVRKLTILILSNEEFSLPQVSSPIVLPDWFPVLGGRETYLRISDILQQAEVDLLNGDDARIDQIAALLYEIEASLVSQFSWIANNHPKQLQSLISAFTGDGESAPNPRTISELFQRHISSVAAPRAYRLGAKTSGSLISRFISQVLRSSPDKLGPLGVKVSTAFGVEHSSILKPTLFAIMMRPTGQYDLKSRNWHSAIMSFYQAYQLMNAAAHAGEYPKYPIGLILANAKDLVRFLGDFSSFINAFDPSDSASEVNF